MAVRQSPNLSLDWTCDYHEAMSWLLNGEPVVVRHLLSSHSGRGVQIVFPYDEIPWDMYSAPLFTKLYRAQNRGEHVREYRFYIVNGRCVDVAEKRRYSKDRRELMDIPDTPVTKYVRTSRNGWVYARNTMSMRDFDPHRSSWSLNYFKGEVEQLADSFGMQFGGIDCIARLGPKDEEGYRELLDWRVVEPNTAIGFGDSNTLRLMCDELTKRINHLLGKRQAA